MIRVLLALTLLLANLGGPKVCCCLLTPIATVASHPTESPPHAGCCSTGSCHLITLTPVGPASLPTTPCPYVNACADSDVLGLPESPTGAVGGDADHRDDTDNFVAVFTLVVPTTAFPSSVRRPLPQFASTRDRLAAYSIFLC